MFNFAFDSVYFDIVRCGLIKYHAYYNLDAFKYSY